MIASVPAADAVQEQHLFGEVFISTQPGLAFLLLALGVGVDPV